MKKETREYYILAGGKGMKKLLIEKGICISSKDLLIVSEYSKLGKMIKKKSIFEYKKMKNENR